MITGRITGGNHGWPFAAATFDLAASGYVEEEWRLDGEAQMYEHRAGTGRSFDGRWSAEPAGTVAFATRLLVRRPHDVDAANAVVTRAFDNRFEDRLQRGRWCVVDDQQRRAHPDGLYASLAGVRGLEPCGISVSGRSVRGRGRRDRGCAR